MAETGTFCIESSRIFPGGNTAVSNDQDLENQASIKHKLPMKLERKEKLVRINEQDEEKTINQPDEKDLSTGGQVHVLTDNQENYENNNSKKCQFFKRCCPNGLIKMCLSKGEDRQVVALIKELIVYLIFLSLLSTTLDLPPTSVNELEVDLIKKKFAEHVMLDALYWDTWYNEKTTVGNERSILYVNRLLGAPRLRQLRVRNNSCIIPDEFKRAITDCYNVYSSKNEDTQSYGVYDGTAWNYNSAEKLGGSNYWGMLAWYGKGGFYVDLGVNRSKTEEILTELKLYRWIDQASRAVFLDFTVYNANVNLFCVIRLVFEFPPTGGMIPSWNFETSKLIRYISSKDIFIAALEIIFVIFTLYYFVEELQEGAKDLVGFAVMFSIVFLAYAQLGYLMFGSHLIDFSSISNSIFTLLRVLLGDFDFYALEEIHGVLGPIFFLSYVFIVFFILMKWKTFKRKLTRSEELKIMEETLTEISANDRTSHYEDVQRILKRRGLGEQQLKEIYETYDRDKNLVLDEKEMQYALSNIKEKFEDSIKDEEEILNTESQNLSRWARRRYSGREFSTLFK
ncbi:polycystin-2-like [Limulus polyphemus]|uniref:Polycystin-2-like n=1 Tax=Limulus polyphemus TaxID=6850 RepID=A0ABM1BJ94_LIMPO|nr:polycystin-2-like [Limulus polyphemus]